jgi:hypothetical protein
MTLFLAPEPLWNNTNIIVSLPQHSYRQDVPLCVLKQNSIAKIIIIIFCYTFTNIMMRKLGRKAAVLYNNIILNIILIILLNCCAFNYYWSPFSAQEALYIYFGVVIIVGSASSSSILCCPLFLLHLLVTIQ